MSDTLHHDRLAALIAHGEELGCLDLSEVEGVLEGARGRRRRGERVLRGRRAARHRGQRRLRPCQCRRRDLPQRRPHARDDRCAPALPQRGGPLATPDRGAGDRARKAHRARRPRREGADDQLQPAPRRLDRQALPGSRPDAPRPDPGGDHRPDPRGREIRLAQGLQVLDLRHVVDPPGRPARRRRQGPDDPRAGARPRPRAQDGARRGRARSAARAAADRRGARHQAARISRKQLVTGTRGRAGRDEPRQADGRGRPASFGDVVAVAPEHEHDGEPLARTSAKPPSTALSRTFPSASSS